MGSRSRRWRNIGPTERKRRKLFGHLTLLAIAAAFVAHSVVPDLAWVLAVGFLAWSAALLLLQAKTGVSVLHAAMGTVCFGRGPLPIRSPKIKTILRRHALRVHLLAATSWGVATTLCAVVKL